MKITNETIDKIETIFGFSLYDWQREYLKGQREYPISGNRNGKTFAYCLRLLLSDGDSITINRLHKYSDILLLGNRYNIWFKHYCLDINRILIENGFSTRIKEGR